MCHRRVEYTIDGRTDWLVSKSQSQDSHTTRRGRQRLVMVWVGYLFAHWQQLVLESVHRAVAFRHTYSHASSVGDSNAHLVAYDATAAQQHGRP
jgi:hypothetical protein